LVVASPNTVAALPSVAVTSPVLAALPSPCCSTPPGPTLPVFTGESRSSPLVDVDAVVALLDVAVVDVDLCWTSLSTICWLKELSSMLFVMLLTVVNSW
jgi:hypothetical protein